MPNRKNIQNVSPVPTRISKATPDIRFGNIFPFYFWRVLTLKSVYIFFSKEHIGVCLFHICVLWHSQFCFAEAVSHHTKIILKIISLWYSTFEAITRPYFSPYRNHNKTITKSYRNHKRKKHSNNFSSPKDNSQPYFSSILMGFSLINHPFWGTPIYGNPQISTEKKKTWKVSPFFFQMGQSAEIWNW